MLLIIFCSPEVQNPHSDVGVTFNQHVKGFLFPSRRMLLTSGLSCLKLRWRRIFISPRPNSNHALFSLAGRCLCSPRRSSAWSHTCLYSGAVAPFRFLRSRHREYVNWLFFSLQAWEDCAFKAVAALGHLFRLSVSVFIYYSFVFYCESRKVLNKPTWLLHGAEVRLGC